MTRKEIKDFTYKNHHRRIRCSKENSYYSMKDKKRKSVIACN